MSGPHGTLLLIGGSGQLGTELQRCWVGGVVAPTHSELDLRDASVLEGVLSDVRPDIVINCSAFHNVDRCESEQEEAFTTNAIAVGNAAQACSAASAYFVTVSSDYVFDGAKCAPYMESDVPRPLSAYGISKLAGEMLVARLGTRALVVRTAGVYGARGRTSKGHTFVDRILEQARRGETARVVSDTVVSPTYAGHLARAIAQLAGARATGLIHVANSGTTSWYEFAVEALRLANIDAPVEPISADAWKSRARRPKYSALGSERLGDFGVTMPSWKEGLADYVRSREASAPTA
jgi:dTDP-4-dehydrorhamnose reductase